MARKPRKEQRKDKRDDHREELVREVTRLARRAIHGAASETYRTCGNKGCRCHSTGPKHGPHMYVAYQGPRGKTTGYYVPKAAQQEIREGIQAWHDLQQRLRELAEQTKDRILQRAKARVVTPAGRSRASAG
jgi:hypothetical protein